MTGDRARVLWLTKGLGRGGAEMLLVELAQAINQQRVELEVGYVLPHKDALVAPLEGAGVRVFCLGADGPWLPALWRRLVRGRYDVIHSHAPVVGAAARLLAPRGTHLAHTEHNMWGRYRRATRWANAATIHRNDVVWPVSQGVAGSIRPWFGSAGRPRVEVMLHGIAPGGIANGPAARAEARRRLQLAPDALVVGVVGNLTPKKDHETLIRAFALMTDDQPEARLVIIGGGPREQHLRACGRQYGVAAKLVLTGVRDDVSQLLAGFDLFAMSSLHEGLSIALIEALAAGLPIVATRVGGIPELIVDGRHGLLVPPRDPVAFCSAMSRVLGDDALRTAMVAAAKSRATEFGVQNAADTLQESYLAFAGVRRGQVGVR